MNRRRTSSVTCGAEVEILTRGMRCEEPAHGVDADLVGRVVEPDRVALALVHLLALLVAHQGVGEDVLKGGVPVSAVLWAIIE